MRQFTIAGLICGALFAGTTLVAGQAQASTILETYEFQGQPGNQTSVAPAFVAGSLTGISFGEVGLTPTSGANSINASGWTVAGAAYTFGFSIASGAVASVDQIVLSTRSSATGPGFLSVQASVNGGAFTTVGGIVQSGTNFNDEMLSITPISATGSLQFRIVAANQVAANGAATGAGGTFRVGDYNPSGTPTPFTLLGTVTTVTPPPASVPEPSSWAMLAFGMSGLLVLRRRLT